MIGGHLGVTLTLEIYLGFKFGYIYFKGAQTNFLCNFWIIFIPISYVSYVNF